MAQADGTIQNDTGANVRADLNNNFAALFSNSSGGSAPSTTYAYQFWIDTANNLLKLRNGANSAWITLGSSNTSFLGLAQTSGSSFTGALLGVAGTASSPSFSFSADTDTGLYRGASNAVYVSAGGTNTFRFANTFSQSVVPLRLPDGAAATAALSNTGDENTGLYWPAADQLGVTIGGTARFRFSADGLDALTAKPVRFHDNDSSNYAAIKAPATLSANYTLTLPGNDGDADQYLKTDGSGNLTWANVSQPAGVPTGSIFCMPTATVPSGYLECDGSAVSRTTYADLFTLIGTAYGAANGSSTFNVPDLRGEFVRGWAHGRTGKDPDDTRAIGSTQTSANLSHRHTTVLDGYNVEVQGGGGYSMGPGNRPQQARNWSASSGMGLSGGTESRPINIALMYVIKT